MKQYMEVNEESGTNFGKQLTKLAEKDWRIVPGCYIQLNSGRSSVMMERDTDDNPNTFALKGETL